MATKMIILVFSINKCYPAIYLIIRFILMEDALQQQIDHLAITSLIKVMVNFIIKALIVIVLIQINLMDFTIIVIKTIVVIVILLWVD